MEATLMVCDGALCAFADARRGIRVAEKKGFASSSAVAVVIFLMNYCGKIWINYTMRESKLVAGQMSLESFWLKYNLLFSRSFFDVVSSIELLFKIIINE